MKKQNKRKEICKKRKGFLTVAVLILLCCTGCTESSWEKMKEQGAELLEQGQELNQELKEEAEQVNEQILSGEWK